MIFPTPGIGTMIDFAAAPPGEQFRTVKTLHKTYTDESARPWSFYGPMRCGIKRAIASTDPAAELQKVVEAVQSTSKAAHFQELREGFLRWRQTNPYSLVPVGKAVWSDAEASFKVGPEIGLRDRSGNPCLAVVLYMKRDPLSRRVCDIPLWMMKQVQDLVLPGGEPAILDVRRGKLWTLNSKTSSRDLDVSLVGAVASFTAMWRSIA